jgi:hypothetical protein
MEGNYDIEELFEEIANRKPKADEIFEGKVRKTFSDFFGVELKKRKVPSVPKVFDMVSSDHTIVGDAKYWNWKPNRQGQSATITEYVWLLEKVVAKEKFLVFGKDRKFPSKWLEKYNNLIKDIKFYFMDNDGNLEQLN